MWAGRVFGSYYPGMSVTQFVAVGHIASDKSRVSLFAKTFIGDALSIEGSVDVRDFVEWFLEIRWVG